MRLGRVLDRQAAVEQFVGLHVLARQDLVRVVILGEEAAGAQDDHRQAVLVVDETAHLLGGELGDAVDVARLQRGERLVDPHRFVTPALADRVRDHQRGGRGEDETIGFRRHRRLEQVERAADIDVDERLARITHDVGLVQRPGVDDGLEAMFGEEAVDERAVGDASDHIGARAARDVEADDLMAVRAQQRGEIAAEPARGSGEEDAHGGGLAGRGARSIAQVLPAEGDQRARCAFRNATLSASTAPLPRNGFDSAIATCSWLRPG